MKRVSQKRVTFRLSCWLFWGPEVVAQGSVAQKERPHVAVAAPTWFLARAVAMRELECSSGELVELGVEATTVVPHITVRWSGSASGARNNLRTVEKRNAR